MIARPRYLSKLISKKQNGLIKIITGNRHNLMRLNPIKTSDAINEVNARYGYKPEFHEIYAQAGAEVSLKGSTPSSQNPKENTAVAISDVNDDVTETIIVVIAIYSYATEFLIVTLRWVLLPVQHTTKSNESQNIPITESHSLK